MKLSRTHVDIGPEHVGHTIRFVEVCGPPPSEDTGGIVCAVCCTCGNPPDEDSVVLVAIIEDQETIDAITAEMGAPKKIYIEPGAGIQ